MIHPNGNLIPAVGARRPAGRKQVAALALAAWLTQLAAPALAAPADSTWASRARECAASAQQVRFQVGQRRFEPEFFSVEATGIRCEASSEAATREYESSSLTARRRPANIELRLVRWDEISRVEIRSVRPSGGGGLIGLLVGGGLGALVVSGSKPKGPFAIFAAPYYVAAAVVLVGGGAVLGAVIGSSPRDTGWVTCCQRDSATTAVHEPAPTR